MEVLFPDRALFQMLPYNGEISFVSPETERIVQMINFLNLSSILSSLQSFKKQNKFGHKRSNNS